MMLAVTINEFVPALLSLALGLLFGWVSLRLGRRRKSWFTWAVLVVTVLLTTIAALVGIQSATSAIQRNLPPHNPLVTFHTSGQYPLGQFVLSVGADAPASPRLTITHRSGPGRVLWESIPKVAFVGAAIGVADIRQIGVPQAAFDIRDKLTATCDQQSVDGVQQVGGDVVISGTLTGTKCAVGYTLAFTATSSDELRFVLKVTGNGSADINRLYLRSASTADEHFFGLGQQLTYFDQKGLIVPILVQEHGVGRGLPVFTQLIDLTQNGGGGEPTDTGAPAPHYISSKLRSLFLENEEYSVFDLHHADRVEIEVFAHTMTGRILYGKTPLDLIQTYTAYAGRMRRLPDWIQQGAIVSIQGGTEEALHRLDQLNKAGVPIAAFWFQDWTGVRITPVGEQLWWNWELNETHYPGWDGLVSRLAQQGARTMIYINPFLVNEPGHDRLYNEAQRQGYLVMKRDGTPYLIRNTSFSAAMVDLSNPGARTWMKQIIKDNLITRAGASGWMRDFGEALPFDAGTLQRRGRRRLAQSLHRSVGSGQPRGDRGSWSRRRHRVLRPLGLHEESRGVHIVLAGRSAANLGSVRWPQDRRRRYAVRWRVGLQPDTQRHWRLQRIRTHGLRSHGAGHLSFARATDAMD